MRYIQRGVLYEGEDDQEQTEMHVCCNYCDCSTFCIYESE